jgi:multicomponent Na+:H+ antiporter subunit G
MMTFFGFLFILLGVISFIISSIGLLRMPDLYSRIHAGAKSPTLATTFVVIGAIFLEPTWAPKLILLAFFVLATNPLSSSVIARASHKANVPHLNSTDIDELKKEESK